MCLSVCLSMCLSICLFVSLSMCLSGNLLIGSSIEEECRQSVCTTVLEKRNMTLHASFRRLTVVVSKVDCHLQAVVLAGTGRCIPIS